MGTKHSHSKKLKVKSDGPAFAIGWLGRNNKTFRFSSHLISYLLVSWGKILDFVCVSPNIFLQLTDKYGIR